MSLLLKLKSAPFVLIEDDINQNTIPLLLDLVQGDKGRLHFFSYEQDLRNWKAIFRHTTDAIFHEEFFPEDCDKFTGTKGIIIIDSLNQIILSLGWSIFQQNLRKLRRNANIIQIIVILHKDCLAHTSQLHHIGHLASATVSYSLTQKNKVSITLKKNGKVFRSEEMLYYDDINNVLKSKPIQEEHKAAVADPQQPSPGSLTTFKIEVDQIEKMEKSKLKLPYMSKINHGDSKVFYEPDAVDDWDEEDPDEDLDI